jgi:competence protein ComEA
MRTDHKALLFIGAIGVLGAGVRVVRASAASTTELQPALQHQIQAADSAAKATHARKGRKRKASPGGAPDSARKVFGGGPLDRPGYIAGRLDLDVATAAQIDSLPGVTPTMARRIVADRMIRGPFLSRDGLRRVTGVGPRFIAGIDSLITFSGTVLQPNPADTVIVPRSRARVPKRRP